MKYEDMIKGKTACIDFDSLIPTESIPFPNNRSLNFMTLGPFALETDGAFETEYLYERNKTLDCDYLASSGGEALSAPYIGKRVKNDYMGDEFLCWEQSYIKWDQLRFDKEGKDCNKVIYATEQRNCVYYAAVYVNCSHESSAVICYEDSGSLLYLNGELIANQPYGRTKGITDFGHQVAVTFRKGLNLILFKLRVGYICDTFDLGINHFFIFPSALESDGVCVTYPQPTSAFFGDKNNPRQVFALFAGALMQSTEKSELCCSANGYSEKLEIEALKKGECTPLRMSVPSSDKPEAVKADISLNGKAAEYFIETIPYSGYSGTEHLYSDFHFDTTYHQEQRTYAMGAIYITKCMVEMLEKNNEFCATLSEVDYLHPYYSIYPHHRQTIKKAFEQGRAEADCFYNQPNDLTSSGEGFVRNLIYGQLYHRDVMGRTTYVYAPGDVFGHCNQLSQICKKGGVSAIRWGKTVWGLDAAFHHISPDLSDLIHNKGTGMQNAMRLGLSHCTKISTLRPGIVSFPQTGDTSWQRRDTITHAHLSVFSELDLGIIEDDRQMKLENGISKLELCSRDLTQHHSGVLLTRTDFKQANRICENLLVTAEKFSSIAALYGAEYPEKALDKAWRQLICAQHHDSVTGTNNEISFVDLMIEYREAAEIGADIVKNACAYIASGVKCSCDGEKVTVFNPHEWDRKEPCTFMLPDGFSASELELVDNKGKVYRAFSSRDAKPGTATFIPSVPALGYSVFYLRCAEDKAVSVSDSNVIENSFYRVTVDASLGGGIVSVYDKKAKREVIDFGADGPANRIAVLREVANRMETQHEIYTTGQKLFSSDFNADVVSEKCSEYQKLTITVQLDIIARVRQEITLWHGVKRIDMKTIVEDYQFRDDLFTLTFPVNVRGGKTVFDDRFAPHVSGKSKNKLSFQTHQHASYSHSRIVPANQWLELGPTVTARILASNKVCGSVNIGMTSIIRCDNKPIMLCANKLLEALTKKAVPVTLFSDREQHGHDKVIHFNEDLTNTDTRFVLCTGEDNLYEQKLLSSLSPAARKRFLDSATKKVSVLFTVDSDNIFKKPIDVFLIKAPDTDSLDKYIDTLGIQLDSGASFDIMTNAIGTKPCFADDYGVALINNGTISCSVEGDNMMNMMLFHTADFYGNEGNVTGDEQLIPEQKTHVFNYALYPHSGDYRQSDVYRKAFEFNDPLIASQSDIRYENACLPESKSFLRCDSGFAVTALKLKGFPIAQMKADIGNAESRGLAIRGFEYNGLASNARLKFGFDISDVKRTDLLEENGADIKSSVNAFSTDCTRHSIETFTFNAKADSCFKNAVLGINCEPVEPTYVRSWEHDLGSLPIGYMRVAGVIGKHPTVSEDGLSYTFEISMVNNQPDAPISGTMHFSVPEGFVSDINDIEYDIPANGDKEWNVTVTKPSADANGIIQLDYEHDGQHFYDVYEFGYFNPDVSLEITDNKLTVTVANYTGASVIGQLAIASPFETWSLENMNPSSLGGILPYVIPVSLDDGETREYCFTAQIPDIGGANSLWAAAKLMVNGRIHFAFDRVIGERHNKWTHVFWGESVGANNGSLEKLLKMN